MRRDTAHHEVMLIGLDGKLTSHSAHPSLKSAGEHAKPHGKRAKVVTVKTTSTIKPCGRR